MEEIPFKIRCQLEELAPIGSIILVSARRDQAVIVVKDPSFTSAYLEGVETKQFAVEALVPPAIKTAIGKQITRLLYVKLYGIRDRVDDLELILKKAEPLMNASVKDFKLGVIREAISTHNVEGAMTGIDYTMGLVDLNFAVLNAKGFTQAQREWFETTKTEIKASNVSQSVVVSERRILTQANRVTINDYWDELVNIMTTGRLVFKKDAARRKDYTYRLLLHQVRAAKRKEDNEPGMDETTGMLSGTVTDKATGEPEANVEVTVINTSITTETDEDGAYTLDGIGVGEVSVSFKKAGKVEVLEDAIEIKAGVETERDVEMEDEV